MILAGSPSVVLHPQEGMVKDCLLAPSGAKSGREVGTGDLCFPLPCFDSSMVLVRLHRKQNTRPLRDGCCYNLTPPDCHAAIFALLRRRHPANAAPPAKMAIAAHVPGSGMGADAPARTATFGLLS